MAFVQHSNLAKILSFYGKHQRRKGAYSDKTLKYFSYSKNVSPDASSHMDYISFKRDLGNKASIKDLKKISFSYKQLSTRQQLLLFNFLLEIEPHYPLLNLIEPDYLSSLAIHSPAIAKYCLDENIKIVDDAKWLAQVNNQKKLWGDFQDYLKAHEEDLAIVGNSGRLNGLNMGKTIEQHQLVARFNQYPHQSQHWPHSGEKTNIWIRSPDLKLPHDFPQTPIEWMVLSGPDIRFTLSDWSKVLPYLQNGTKILTVPIDIWKPLVGKLLAPPSAGILFIAWIKYLIPEWRKNFTIYGFQKNSINESNYHFNRKLKPSKRHYWKGESDLLYQWKTEGKA